MSSGTLEERLENLKRKKNDESKEFCKREEEKKILKEKERRRKENIGKELIKIAEEKFLPFLKVVSSHLFGKEIEVDSDIDLTEKSAYVYIGFRWDDHYEMEGPISEDIQVRRWSEIFFFLYDDLSAKLEGLVFNLKDKDWEMKVTEKLFTIIEKKEYRK